MYWLSEGPQILSNDYSIARCLTQIVYMLDSLSTLSLSLSLSLYLYLSIYFFIMNLIHLWCITSIKELKITIH